MVSFFVQGMLFKPTWGHIGLGCNPPKMDPSNMWKGFSIWSKELLLLLISLALAFTTKKKHGKKTRGTVDGWNPANHLLSMKPYEKLDILHINWLAGFQPSTVSLEIPPVSWTPWFLKNWSGTRFKLAHSLSGRSVSRGTCIPSGKLTHSDCWNIPILSWKYIFNPGPFFIAMLVYRSVRKVAQASSTSSEGMMANP